MTAALVNQILLILLELAGLVALAAIIFAVAKWANTSDDNRLTAAAKRQVRAVEQQFFGAPGSEKRREAVQAIQRLFPRLPGSLIEAAVESAVHDMNATAKPPVAVAAVVNPPAEPQGAANADA